MYKWILTLIILAGIAFWIFSSAQEFKPEFKRIQNINIETSGNSAEINAEIILFNAGNIDAQLINTELRAYSNDMKIATISQTDLSVLKPEQEFNLPIACKVDLQKLALSNGMSSWIEMALNENRNIKIRIEGYCQVKLKGNSFRIPVTHEETISFK